MEGKKKNYYHVSSEALEKNDIFQSREDFVTAMNDIALGGSGSTKRSVSLRHAPSPNWRRAQR